MQRLRTHIVHGMKDIRVAEKVLHYAKWDAQAREPTASTRKYHYQSALYSISVVAPCSAAKAMNVQR